MVHVNGHMQMQAVNVCLQTHKTQYLQRIREWQASLKYYDEAVKLDILRLSLLRDVAGVDAGTPQVGYAWSQENANIRKVLFMTPSSAW